MQEFLSKGKFRNTNNFNRTLNLASKTQMSQTKIGFDKMMNLTSIKWAKQENESDSGEEAPANNNNNFTRLSHFDKTNSFGFSDVALGKMAEQNGE